MGGAEEDQSYCFAGRRFQRYANTLRAADHSVSSLCSLRPVLNVTSCNGGSVDWSMVRFAGVVPAQPASTQPALSGESWAFDPSVTFCVCVCEGEPRNVIVEVNGSAGEHVHLQCSHLARRHRLFLVFSNSTKFVMFN